MLEPSLTQPCLTSLRQGLFHIIRWVVRSSVDKAHGKDAQFQAERGPDVSGKSVGAFYPWAEGVMKSIDIEKAIRDLKVREPFSAETIHRVLPDVDIAKIAIHLRKHSVKINREHRLVYIRVIRGWYRFNDA